jgi:hypothetical protein
LSFIAVWPSGRLTPSRRLEIPKFVRATVDAAKAVTLTWESETNAIYRIEHAPVFGDGAT